MLAFALPSEEEETPAVESGGSLESMTVVELKDLAKSIGLSGYSAMNKAELIAAIEAAQSG